MLDAVLSMQDVWDVKMFCIHMVCAQFRNKIGGFYQSTVGLIKIVPCLLFKTFNDLQTFQIRHVLQSKHKCMVLHLAKHYNHSNPSMN